MNCSFTGYKRDQTIDHIGAPVTNGNDHRVKEAPDQKDSDYISSALAHVRELSGGAALALNARVNLHFQPDLYLIDGTSVLDGLVASGMYLSQFETGVSNGGRTAHPGGDRFAWEQRMFVGLYDTLRPITRPKNGALSLHADPYGAAPRFGACYFRLRREVLDRATFCYPDSVFQPDNFVATAAQCARSCSGIRRTDWRSVCPRSHSTGA